MSAWTRLAARVTWAAVIVTLWVGGLGVYPVPVQAANPDAINWLFSVVATDVDLTKPLGLAVDGLGRRHVVYTYNNTIHYTVYENRQWNERATIALGGGFSAIGEALSLVVDYRNFAHICYTQRDSGSKASLFYALYDTSLHTAAALDTGDAGYYCSIAVNDGGYPAIAYFERAHTALKYVKKARAGWGTPEEVLNVASDSYNFISLRLNSSGYPHLAYCTGAALDTCSTLNYSYSNGTSWSHELVDNAAGAGYYPSLAFTPGRTVKIAYHLLNTALKIATRTTTLPATWDKTTVESGDVGLYASLAVDASSVAHVAYFDETLQRGKYARVPAGGAPITTLTSSGAAGTRTVLALDPSGRPQIAYHDIARTNVNFMGMQPLSDLIVSGLWRDKNDPTQLVAAIRNDGADTQVSNFNAAWYVDSVLKTTNTLVAPNLAVDGVVNTQFSLASWTCSGASDTLKVCLATAQSEYSTANNCLEKVWVCDTTPPVITSGPTITAVSTTGFTVNWTTDEAATSEVRYTSRPRMAGQTASAAGTGTSHSVAISGLSPNTAYYVSARSVNSSGLATVSREVLARTTAAAQAKPADPTITILPSGAGFEQYEFSASFADTSGIAQIRFLLDTQVVGSSFTPKYAPGADPRAALPGSFQVMMAPGAAGLSRADFFKAHSGQVVATMASGVTYAWPFNFAPANSQPTLEASLVSPGEGQKYYYNSGSTIPAGTIIPIDVYAVQYDWGCTWKDADDPDLDPGSPPVYCGDVAGEIQSMRFRLDGTLLGTLTAADVQAGHTYRYNLDLSGKPLGNRVVEVSVFGSDGVSKTLSRTLNFTLGIPSLSVSRSVTRNQNFFDVTLSVTNSAQASGPAYLDDISDYFVGFQAADRIGSYTFTPRYLGGHEGSMLIQTGGLAINPGATIDFTYKLVPVLYADMNSAVYRIGHKPVDTHYARPGQGSSYVAFNHETIQINDASGPGGKLGAPASVHNAFKRSDYILLTSPANLVTRFNYTRTNPLLAGMADLALLKQGVLAFWPADGAMETLNVLLQDGEAWAARMHPNFQVRGKGYVLIVGESEIVPSDTTGPFSVWWADSGHEDMPVHYSDNTYAHTDGNGAPDLLLGRIIGNNPEALLIPIQTSLAVHLTNGWDRGGVYLASGVGNKEEVMQSDADTAAADFTGAGWGTVSKHHWEEEAFLRSYNVDFAEHDGYAAGDLDGDGQGEIIIASRAGNNVRILSGQGTLLNVFALDFEEGDALTAGDTDGDGLDEICIGDRGDQIRCYSGLGTLELTINIDFAAYERIAVGEVWAGNPGKEIVMADDNDYLRILKPDGTALKTIDIGALGFDFADHDLLAVGNVDTSPAIDEIVFTDRTHDKIVVIASDGTVKKQIELDFDYGDGLAVGKVIPGDREQIIIGDRSNNVYVYYGQDSDPNRSYARYNTIYVDWEQYDGMAVRLTPGADNDEIVHFDRGNRVRVLDTYYPRNAIDQFKLNSQNKDLIWLMAHGSPGGMDPAQSLSDFPANFGNAHPIVTAFSCLTGNYEGNNDQSLAEKYLAVGAGIYFGSTEVSPIDHNSMTSRVFFTANWTAGVTFAKAMRAYKQAHWDDTVLTGFWHLWVNEYNLYGDPKFDVFSATVPDAAADPAAAAAPPNPIVIDLPAYTTQTVGEFDQVSIAGGGTYLVENQYQVPTYTYRVEYPAGVHIQNVSLSLQSNLSSQSGLRLALTGATPLGRTPSAAPRADQAQTAWAPEFAQPFSWTVDKDGRVETLLITLYPFNYDPAALYAEYYRHFEFNVQSLTSDFAILKAATDKESYAVGEAVKLDLLVTNAGVTPADVTLSATLQKVGDPATVYAFDLAPMEDLLGKGKISLTWNSASAATGSYTLAVELKDSSNQVVDRVTTALTLGKMDALTTSFSAGPAFFKPGAAVTAQLKITSSGSLPLNGTAVVEVRDAGGNLVQEFTQAITALAPGQFITFSPVWNTTGASGERYHILGYARFESEQSAVVDVIVSTRTYRYLPTILR